MGRFDNLKLASVGCRGANAKIEAVKVAVKLETSFGTNTYICRVSGKFCRPFLSTVRVLSHDIINLAKSGDWRLLLEMIRSCTLWNKILIVSPKENDE